MVSGVAGGVADHLNVSDTVVRLVFIAATVFGGFGVLIYAALWFLMPLAAPTVPAAPGLAAHTRGGLRSDQPPPTSESKARRREKNRGQMTALVVVGILVRDAVAVFVAIGGLQGLSEWSKEHTPTNTSPSDGFGP